jgi:hypothetical protein
MITHLVLFRPRPGLPPAAREALAAAFEAAIRTIPSIRGVRVGRRLLGGRPYDALAVEDYQYAALLDFDDLAGLTAYLDHPAHQQLSANFFDACDRAVMYDYELRDAAAGVRAAPDDSH